MPYGYRLEAEFESGFVLVEGVPDFSPYDPGRNTWFAILNGRPTDLGHGAMVRFSLVPLGGGQRYDIDWTSVADLEGIEPVYFRRMRSVNNAASTEGWSEPTCDSQHFGYKYLGSDGEEIEVVEEVT